MVLDSSVYSGGEHLFSGEHLFLEPSNFTLALSLHLTSLCRQNCGCVSHKLWIMSSYAPWEYDKWERVGFFFKETSVKHAVQTFCSCALQKLMKLRKRNGEGRPMLLEATLPLTVPGVLRANQMWAFSGPGKEGFAGNIL